MTTQEKTKKPPTHIIWQIIGENKKSRWIRCGAAWKNKDGKGYLLVFDAYPVAGRTMLRELKDKPSE